MVSEVLMPWPPACSVGRTQRVTVEVGAHPAYLQPANLLKQVHGGPIQGLSLTLLAKQRSGSMVLVTHDLRNSAPGDVMTLSVPIPQDLPTPSMLALYVGHGHPPNSSEQPTASDNPAGVHPQPASGTSCNAEPTAATYMASSLAPPLAYIPVLPPAAADELLSWLYRMASELHDTGASKHQQLLSQSALQTAADFDQAYQHAPSHMQAEMQAAWRLYFQPLASVMAGMISPAISESAQELEERHMHWAALCSRYHLPLTYHALVLDMYPQAACSVLDSAGINRQPSETAVLYQKHQPSWAMCAGGSPDSMIEPQLRLLLRQVIPETPRSTITTSSSYDALSKDASRSCHGKNRAVIAGCSNNSRHNGNSNSRRESTRISSSKNSTVSVSSSCNATKAQVCSGLPSLSDAWGMTEVHSTGLQSRRSQSQQLDSSQSFDMRQLSFGSLHSEDAANERRDHTREGPDMALLTQECPLDNAAAAAKAAEQPAALRCDDSFCMFSTHRHTSQVPLPKQGHLDEVSCAPAPNAGLPAETKGVPSASRRAATTDQPDSVTTLPVWPGASKLYTAACCSHTAAISMPPHQQQHQHQHQQQRQLHPVWTTTLSVAASPGHHLHLAAAAAAASPTAPSPPTFPDPFHAPALTPPAPPTYAASPGAVVGTPKALRLMLQLLTPSTPSRPLAMWDGSSHAPNSPCCRDRAAFNRTVANLGSPLLETPTPHVRRAETSTTVCVQPKTSCKAEAAGHVSLQVLAGCCYEERACSSKCACMDLSSHVPSYSATGFRQPLVSKDACQAAASCLQPGSGRCCTQHSVQWSGGKRAVCSGIAAAATAAGLVWLVLTAVLMACVWGMGAF